MATSNRQVSTSQPCPVVLARSRQASRPTDAGQAGHAVDHRDADARRRPVGLAGQLHQARLGLHQEVVARPVGALVVAAVGRDVQADDRGIEVPQARIVEAELGRLRAAQVVDHAVGGLHQRLELPRGLRADLRSSVTLFLPRFQAWKYSLSSSPSMMRPDLARRIAVGRLDLDHLGAELGQEHRAVGPGAELLERQDAHARRAAWRS